VKFVIRRAVVGVLAIPFVAGAWCFVYLAFLLAGAEGNQTITETFNNGLMIGIVVALAFTFSTQLDKFISKIVGE